MKWTLEIEITEQEDGKFSSLGKLTNDAAKMIQHASTAGTVRSAIVWELDYFHQLMSSKVKFGEGVGTPLVIDPMDFSNNMQKETGHD